MAQCVSEKGTLKKENMSQEWQLFQRKRLRNRLIGSEGKAVTKPDERFKAANGRIPLFINNVDKESCESDILDYIKQKNKYNICHFEENCNEETKTLQCL